MLYVRERERDQKITQVRSYCLYPSFNILLGFRKFFQPPSKMRTEKANKTLRNIKQTGKRLKYAIFPYHVITFNYLSIRNRDSKKIGGNKHFLKNLFIFWAHVWFSFCSGEGRGVRVTSKILLRRPFGYRIVGNIITRRNWFEIYYLVHNNWSKMRCQSFSLLILLLISLLYVISLL